MIKFTMNNKELKNMMEKASVGIDKKAVFEPLKRVYLQIDEENNLRLWGGYLEIYSEAISRGAWNTEAGVIGLGLEEIKLISKLNSDITLQQIEEGKAVVKCGKKSLTIPCYGNTDIFPPVMENAHDVIQMIEGWALETLVNVEIFTGDFESNKMMGVINLNIQEGRVEALDGHRIGMRKLEGLIKAEENILILNKGIPVLKKLMDKKSHKGVMISTDGKYLRIAGDGFNYYQRVLEGDYFNTKQLLQGDFNGFSFTADANNLMEVMKFDIDIVKEFKKPVIFTPYNNNLYLYCSGKYEALDQLKVKDLDMKLEAIGFNPSFFVDALKVADVDEVLIQGNKAKSPLMIYGGDYSFLLLPINISEVNIGKIHNKILENVA